MLDVHEMLTFAEALDNRLWQTRMTKAQLARELGVTRGAVGSWTSGRSLPDERRLPEIAAAVGCDVSELPLVRVDGWRAVRYGGKARRRSR